MALIEASKPRTGKTLLSEVLILASLGVMPALTSMPPNEEEMRKSLVTLALYGKPYWVLDNLNDKLDSAALASSLTTGRIQGRLLGGNREVDTDIAAVMVATANQPVATTEMLARSYRIRLNADMSRPQDRTDFKHTHIIRYTLTHRAEIVAAGLTIICAYLLAGSPTCGLPAKGGYEDWVSLIGGALAYAGVSGFLGNERALAESADDESGEVERFLAALWSQYSRAEWRVGQLLKDANASGSELGMALPAALAEAIGYPASFTRKAGIYLGKLADVPYGTPEIRLRRREDSHSKQWVWRLESSAPAPVREPDAAANGRQPAESASSLRALLEVHELAEGGAQC